MASDLISRSALLEDLRESKAELKRILEGLQCEMEWRICEGQVASFAEVIMRVKDAQVIYAEPVRHAEWIPWEHNGKVSKHLMTCSGCRRYQWPKNDVLAFDRCPKCGAMMIGGAK